MRVLFILLATALPLFAQRTTWYTDYPTAKAEAKRTNKPLLVVFRCEPCTDFAKFDAQVRNLAKPLDTVADSFVRVRLTRLSGLDLSLFDFDFDLSWAAMMLNADEIVYGRYGGRDATSIDGRLSVAGLSHAMHHALALHQAGAGHKPNRTKPIKIEDYPAAKLRKRNDCLHCHLVNEFRRYDALQAKTWTAEARWVYPLPENIGLTLELDRGNVVKAVADQSTAAKTGLKPGAILKELNGYPLGSSADVQYALHQAPTTGTIALTWTDGGEPRHGKLALSAGWRFTDTTWRPSLLNIIPSPEFSGADLSAEDKKGLNFPATQAICRQDKFVHSTLKAAGFLKDDIITGVNGQAIPGTMDDFQAHLRRTYLSGDTVTINIVRNGEKRALTLTLK
jgi:hypothetical protein